MIAGGRNGSLGGSTRTKTMTLRYRFDEGSLIGMPGPTLTFVDPTVDRPVVDHEGQTRLVKVNEPRFTGLRRAENLLTASEDLSDAAWVASNATKSGMTVTATAGNATVLQSVTLASASVVWRCEITRVTGSGDVDLTVDGGSTWTTVAVTTTTQVFSVSQAAVTNPQAGVRLVTSGDEITFDKMQLEDVTGADDETVPNECVASALIHNGLGVTGVKNFKTVNGNSVASNVVTEARGANIAAATRKGLLCEDTDDCSTTDVSWFNGDMGTWYTRCQKASHEAVQNYIFHLGATLADEISLRYHSDSSIPYQIRSANVGRLWAKAGGVYGAEIRWAGRYNFLSDTARPYMDGVAADPEDTAISPEIVTPTIFYVGGDYTPNRLNGHIAELRYYKKDKLDDALATMTA